MEDYWHSPAGHLAKRIWMRGFLFGIIVVSAIFLVVLLVRGIYAPPTSKVSPVKNSPLPTQPSRDSQVSAIPPVKAISPPLTPATVVLKTQLEKVLAGVKEANQKKNLNQLMTFYSRTSPELRKRAQHIAQFWGSSNLSKMDFRVVEVNPLPDARVFARVIWNVQRKDPRTAKMSKITRTYLVWFVNEFGEWRIQAIKKVG
jgi:hypothetical protein